METERPYLVISPEMSETIPILDDGSGPTEYFRCAIDVRAKNKREAKIKAIKHHAMQEWVVTARKDDQNPFVGLTVKKIFVCNDCDYYHYREDRDNIRIHGCDHLLFDSPYISQDYNKFCEMPDNCPRKDDDLNKVEIDNYK